MASCPQGQTPRFTSSVQSSVDFLPLLIYFQFPYPHPICCSISLLSLLPCRHTEYLTVGWMILLSLCISTPGCFLFLPKTLNITTLEIWKYLILRQVFCKALKVLQLCKFTRGRLRVLKLHSWNIRIQLLHLLTAKIIIWHGCVWRKF